MEVPLGKILVFGLLAYVGWAFLRPSFSVQRIRAGYETEDLAKPKQRSMRQEFQLNNPESYRGLEAED